MDPFNGIVHSSGGVLVHLPLQEVSIQATICDVSAKVVLSQTYENTSDTSTNRAKYVFPVPSRAAVCAFDLEHADGRRIIGVAKEKIKAIEEHEKAIREGKFTGLLEWVTDDVFTISVGSIPARKTVVTRLVYVLDLMDDELADQVRFQVPMALGLRYGTEPSALDEAAAPSSNTRVKITVDIQMSGRLRDVQSPTHAILPLIPHKKHNGRSSYRRATTKFRSTSFLQEDFVLIVRSDGLDAPRCFAERDQRASGTIAMQLTLIPKFKLPPRPAQEFIFVVDRSGSMSGSRISTAKKTLKMLLRMLPSNSTTFNIVSFGSHADSLWQNSQGYSQSSLNQSCLHVESMDANYGGTEIRSALDLALGTRNFLVPTVVFVLTDGEAHDIDNTISTVSRAVSISTPDAPLRVFTLGIGETVSTAMCEGIARAGHGLCLLASTSESIVGKCARLLRAGKSSILKDISVDWGSVAALSFPVQQTPHHIRQIDPGMRFVVFAISAQRSIPKDIVIRGRIDDVATPIEISVPVELVKSSSDDISIPFIHTLAARRLITDLDEGQIPLPNSEPTASAESLRKARIVEIAERYQLASKHTSFVATEDDSQISRRDFRRLPQSSRRNRIYSGNEHNAEYDVDPPESSTFTGAVVDAALSLLSSAFNFATSWLPRGSNPGRSAPITLPGTFASSRSQSRDSSRDNEYRRFDSFSTLSSFDENSSESTSWSSRSPSPSPPASIQEDQSRSPSPVLQSAHGTSGPSRSQGAYDNQLPVRPSLPSTQETLSPQVFELAQLQSFDGSFSPSTALGDIVGEDILNKAADFRVDTTIWATALAVAFLKKHLGNQPDLLAGLLDKTTEFAQGEARFDSLVRSALALMN